MKNNLKALEFFKDWSNYLLVTSVAALGWSSTVEDVLEQPWQSISIWAFATSILFAIFTLAMIPLVAESLTGEDSSIYKVKVRFLLFWLWGPEIGARIKWFCWWQHFAFLVGIAAYAYGASM